MSICFALTYVNKCLKFLSSVSSSWLESQWCSGCTLQTDTAGRQNSKQDERAKIRHSSTVGSRSTWITYYSRTARYSTLLRPHYVQAGKHDWWENSLTTFGMTMRMYVIVFFKINWESFPSAILCFQAALFQSDPVSSLGASKLWPLLLSRQNSVFN